VDSKFNPFAKQNPPTTEMTKSPLSGVGGVGAYIDRTVDKVSFVMFVMKSPFNLAGNLSESD